MAEENLPPQARRLALYSAGGGFGGALLAIVVAKILSGPCCCEAPNRMMKPAYTPAATVTLAEPELESAAERG